MGDMKKKIIRHGPSSLIVALPASWTKKYQLHGGEEITVEEKGNRLVISLPSQVVSRKNFTVGVPSERFIRLLLSIPQKQGYDEIKVTFKERSVLLIIQKEVGQLIGFDIVEAGRDYCIIRSIAKDSEEEFDTILRRTFLLLLQMAEEGYIAIQTSNAAALTSLLSYEEKNNAHTNLCKRILNKGAYPTLEKSHFLYKIVSFLEEIADEYRDICIAARASTKRTKCLPPTLLFYQRTSAVLKDSYTIFYNFNLKAAEDLTNKRESLQQEGERLLQQGKDTLLIHHLLNIIIKSYDMLGPIYGLNL